MHMILRVPLRLVTFIGFSLFGAEKPNVLLIVCDDLNDYVETLRGHPQTKTPNLRKFIESGVSFTQAHCNIPICNPSRASFATGIYPHTSQQFGFEEWDKNEILKIRTMMAHFSANGATLGTGKSCTTGTGRNGTSTDIRPIGPFFSMARTRSRTSGFRVPFRDDFGIIDGTYGPLEKVSHKTSPDTGKPYSWITGGWKKQRELKYESDDDRDLTGDELNAQWAVKRLNELAEEKTPKPFFMGVGFVRPHTPLIVPQKSSTAFLSSIKLPEILKGDAEDTFKNTVASQEDDRSGDRGTKMYDSLIILPR